MPKSEMSFGLVNAIPSTATCGWGARMIFPNDLLHDRQGFFADNAHHGELLMTWLNSGPLNQARASSKRLAAHCEITPDSHNQVTLYEDETGMIVANPNGSYGYVYIAAYLKDSFVANYDYVNDGGDPPQSHDYDDEGNPRRTGSNP